MGIFSKWYYYFISYKAQSTNGISFIGDTLVKVRYGNLDTLRQYVIDANAENGITIEEVVIFSITLLSKKQYKTLCTNN